MPNPLDPTGGGNAPEIKRAFALTVTTRQCSGRLPHDENVIAFPLFLAVPISILLAGFSLEKRYYPNVNQKTLAGFHINYSLQGT